MGEKEKLNIYTKAKSLQKLDTYSKAINGEYLLLTYSPKIWVIVSIKNWMRRVAAFLNILRKLPKEINCQVAALHVD